MSINTKVIPLNPRGALELGLCPCDVCNMGWGSWSKNETKSCQDDCIYWKEYSKLNLNGLKEK